MPTRAAMGALADRTRRVRLVRHPCGEPRQRSFDQRVCRRGEHGVAGHEAHGHDRPLTPIRRCCEFRVGTSRPCLANVRKTRTPHPEQRDGRGLQPIPTLRRTGDRHAPVSFVHACAVRCFDVDSFARIRNFRPSPPTLARRRRAWPVALFSLPVRRRTQCVGNVTLE